MDPRAKVLAFPRKAFDSYSSWCDYVSAWRKLGVYFAVTEHAYAEDCPDLLQCLIFLRIKYDNKRNLFHVFNLPDGRKSCGIPLHITIENARFPGTASLNIYPFYKHSEFNKFIAVFPEEYINSHSNTGAKFPFQKYEISLEWRILFPYYSCFWGSKYNNHVVFIGDVLAESFEGDQWKDQANYCAIPDLLQEPNIDALDIRVLGRTNWWNCLR